jgi:hypothetical protein
MIKEEGVCVFIPDGVHQCDTPQFDPWASPPFENGFRQHCDLGGRGILEIDLLVIIDCRVASFDHFDSAEEGFAHKGWDNVDTTSRFLKIVVQLVGYSCCRRGTIWKMKHGRRHSASWNPWGRREEYTGSGSSVTDCQGKGPNEDALSNTRKDQLDANRFVVVAAAFVLLVASAIFVSVTGWEIETHAFGPLTGHEEGFRRTRGWLKRFDLASKRGPIVA